MLKSVLIAVLGVGLCVCNPPSDRPSAISDQNSKTPVSTSEEWNKSIFDHMSQNEKLCPGSNTYKESEYVKECKGIHFPTSMTNISLEGPEPFLCVGFYDRLMGMCNVGSLSKIGSETTIPKTTEVFDAQVKKLTSVNSKTEVITFCTSWKNHYPASYIDLEKWITLLNGTLSDPVKCIKVCTNEKSKLKPICAVLNTMDSITANTPKEYNAPRQESVEETTKKIISKTETPAPGMGRDEGSKETPKTPVSETAVEKAKQKPAAEPQTASKSKYNEKIVNGDTPKIPPVNIPQQAETVPHNLPAPVVENAELPSQSLPGENVKEKVKKPKEEPAVNPKPVAKNPPVDVSANDRTPEDEPPAQDIPNLGNDGAASHEDGREDGILESEGLGSHHTQDQENPDAGEEINDMPQPQEPPSEDAEESPPMPSDKREYIPHLPGSPNDDDSHFFGYFTVIGVICIAGYVGYHNKQKILAMLVEGRRSRGGRGRRRPSTANYRKLDCTLEEAVTSQCNSNVTHVIY